MHRGGYEDITKEIEKNLANIDLDKYEEEDGKSTWLEC